MHCMPGSRKFCQRGSNFDVFGVFFEGGGGGGGGFRGERIQTNTTISGHHRPATKCQLNGVSLAGRGLPNNECWLGSFVIFQAIQASIAKKPFNL